MDVGKVKRIYEGNEIYGNVRNIFEMLLKCFSLCRLDKFFFTRL